MSCGDQRDDIFFDKNMDKIESCEELACVLMSSPDIRRSY